MKISNFKEAPEFSKKFVLATFDIEEVEMVWNGVVEKNVIFRNWELKKGKNNYYVQSKWVGYEETADPTKKISRYAVEIPMNFRKEFNEEVMELLKPYASKIMQ